MNANIRLFLLLGTLLATWSVVGDNSAPHRGIHPTRLDSASTDIPRYFTTPPPVFPRGNSLSQALPDNDKHVKGFLDFYTQQIDLTNPGASIPLVERSELVSLPPRYLDIADNSGGSAPGNFNSSLVCQSCHDSDWKKTLDDLPNMTFWAQGFHDASHPPSSGDLAANWSLFGDWSGSIKALAGRDPVFLAQVETTRQINSKIDGPQIDNLCFRCHSPLGQRQVEKTGTPFDHSMLYATPVGSGYNDPFPTKPKDYPHTGSDFAVYGALARDGISCSACHSIAPDDGLPWKGTDFNVFYGDNQSAKNPQNPYGGDVVGRLEKSQPDPDSATPPEFPFTATMHTQPGQIVGPDTGLNDVPMSRLGLSLKTAATGTDPQIQSYLRDGTVCGSCHAVILPKVPVGYNRLMLVKRDLSPSSCPKSQIFYTGDYLTDRCVGLDYEQTTYFEWLNSGYSNGIASCMNCHMQNASTTADNGNLVVAQQNTDLANFYPAGTVLQPRQYNRHTLLGINLFVHEMFQQFSDVLGIQFYRKEGLLVPPYLQLPPTDLVNNPGAEDGNANGWVADQNPSSPSSVSAATNVTETDGSTAGPHSGRYFFSITGGSAHTSIDLSPYADQIKTGNVKAIVSGYVRPDSQSYGGTHPATLSFTQNAGTDNVSGSAGNFKQWGLVSGVIELKFSTTLIQISAAQDSGILVNHPDFVQQISVDDLSIVLQLPDGSIIRPAGGISPTAPTQAARNYAIPNNLLNAEQSIVDLALNEAQGQAGYGRPAVEVAISNVTTDAQMINATVTVTNNAGHKFPSGAPFRRAFLEVELFDQSGVVLWASGQPNAYGAICDGPCNQEGTNVLNSEFTTIVDKLQPHRQDINSQEQVQIYELRATDDQGAVTSKELQIFDPVKDNRILPKRWTPPSGRTSGDTRLGLNLLDLAKLTMPLDKVPGSTLSTDPYYSNLYKTGGDQVTYHIPLPGSGKSTGWIRVRMNYQSVPPSYLLGRLTEASTLNKGKPEAAMQRLIYMTSRLNTSVGLKNNVADVPNPLKESHDLVQNWTMVLGEATQPINYNQ